MFCPKCKTEYVEGIMKCGDCNLDLISELPPKSIPDKPEYIDYEEVLATPNLESIPILKSILDDAGITYYLNGEEINRLYVPLEPVRLMVKKKEADKARALLDDLKQSFADASAETTGEQQAGDNEYQSEEEPDEDESQENRPSGKLRFFMIGLIIGIVLAGSYSAYYVHEMRHSSGMRTYDDNKDGKPDHWVTYFDDILSHSESDRNFDGKVDAWYHFDNGIIVRSHHDDDFNGLPDITYYYVDGVVDSMECRPNASGVIIKKGFYENGVYKEEWVDSNYDGKFDEKNIYDFTGDKISSSPLR